MTYERKNIKDMQGYVSGEQPESGQVIKLNTNENPYPASPMAQQVLETISINDIRRYPPPTAKALRGSLSALHGLDASCFIVTNGGDELLRLVISTFVEDEEAIGVIEPTYTLYTVLAEAHGCGIKRFSMTSEWELPSDLASKLNSENVKVCFIPNPHAPSGRLMSSERILELAKSFNGIILLDEAYIDFTDPEQSYDSAQLVRQQDNLIVLRTFSKGYSLAGLRMAYGFGSQSLIDPMQYKTKDSYNTDYIAQQIAQAAINDQEYAQQTWRKVRSERELMSQTLLNLEFTIIPSQSNFILATAPEKITAKQLYQALKQRDILVRYFDQDKLHDKLRISIGTAEENLKLKNALIEILQNT